MTTITQQQKEYLKDEIFYSLKNNADNNTDMTDPANIKMFSIMVINSWMDKAGIELENENIEIKPNIDIDTVTEKLYTCFQLFNDKKISEFLFVKQLEKICKNPYKGKKSYWWRFDKTDTLVNDAATVKNALYSTISNKLHLKECIEIALKEKQLQVFFS